MKTLKQKVKHMGNWIKKMSLRKKIILSIIISLIVMISGTCTFYYNYIKNKTYAEYTPPVKTTQVDNTEKEVEYDVVDGITNILLIGTDARELDEDARADSIIIATLDSNSKKIKLTSLFRDTLVDIPGYGEAKLNAAMAIGGKELLIETISETYDIYLDKFAIINFWGFEAIIDQIGGLEIDVKDYQIEELNKYIGESTGGNDCPVTEAGLQVLNGKQALSYARIRYNVGDEYERTERQREVLFKVAEKLKETKPSKYLGIMNKMLDYISTNITPMEALNLAYTIFKFPTLETEQLQIPQTNLSYTMDYKNIGSVFIIDREQNAQVLHYFIFEDKLPNEDEFDYYSLYSVVADYEARQLEYERIYGIIPSIEEFEVPLNNVDIDYNLDLDGSPDENEDEGIDSDYNNGINNEEGSHGSSGGNPTDGSDEGYDVDTGEDSETDSDLEVETEKPNGEHNQ